MTIMCSYSEINVQAKNMGNFGYVMVTNILQ